MRAGDLGSRLMIDPEIREDPFPYYDQLRAQGRIVSSGLALITAHHDVCLAVLRSPDFGQLRLDRLPGPLRLAMKIGGRPVLGPIEPPSMLATDPPDHPLPQAGHPGIQRPGGRSDALPHRGHRRGAAQRDCPIHAEDRPDIGGPTVDLVARYASLLPATVIAEMLGAPVAMRRQFLNRGAGASLSLDIGLTYRDFRHSDHDLAALHRWMLDHFAEIRRAPGNDVLSALVPHTIRAIS